MCPPNSCSRFLFSGFTNFICEQLIRARVGCLCICECFCVCVCVGEQRVKSVPRHFKVAQWPGKIGSHVFNGMLTDDANCLGCEFLCINSVLFTCFRFHVSHQSYWEKRQMKYEKYAWWDEIRITSHENIMCLLICLHRTRSCTLGIVFPKYHACNVNNLVLYMWHFVTFESLVFHLNQKGFPAFIVALPGL